MPVALILLVSVTVLVGVTSEWLVDSINGVTSTGAISTQWVGLILVSKQITLSPRRVKERNIDWLF
jgi:Ca2+/H+ antiporter